MFLPISSYNRSAPRILDMRSLFANIYYLYLIKLSKWLMLIMPVVVLFYNDNGLETYQIYLLQAGYSISVVIFEIPSGYLADIVGRTSSALAGELLGLDEPKAGTKPPATPEVLNLMKGLLPEDANWSAFGISRMEFPIVAQAAVQRVIAGESVKIEALATDDRRTEGDGDDDDDNDEDYIPDAKIQRQARAIPTQNAGTGADTTLVVVDADDWH